ncbi:MAG: hypothetical protein BGO98_18595 [Myxococcales bacterium 68-20]|nr:MAG: hypothetical protein BGO98_18595 [Myxococcales bacterium 68-20]
MSPASRLSHHLCSWLVGSAAAGLVIITAPLVHAQPPLPPAVGGPGQPPPQQQPTSVRGVVGQYLVTPNGNVDGLLLSDNTIVRFPPHLGAQLAKIVKPRDRVTVTGYTWIPKSIQASTITNETTRRSITDTPPAPGTPPPIPPARVEQQQMSARGTIRALTHAPAGEVDGAVLTDGTIVHFPPHVGSQFANLLREGQQLAATGYGVANSYGRGMDANALGPALDRLQPVNPPVPAPGMPPPR